MGKLNWDQPSWPTIRKQVIARDGRRCRHCGRLTHSQAKCPTFRGRCGLDTHVDHWPIRKADGAPDRASACVVACRDCNLRQRGTGDPRQPAQRQAAMRPTPTQPDTTTPNVMAGVKRNW